MRHFLTFVLAHWHLIWTILPIVLFGQSTGPGAQVVPIPPPNSLFPGATAAINAQGGSAIGTATQTATGAASGLDVNSIYNSVVAASETQRKEGQAGVNSSMGASGMGASSDAMRASADYQNQFSANLLSQLQQMQFQSEALKLQGSSQLFETYGTAGMTFAPTAAVVGQQGGPSTFSQLASGSAGMMSMLNSIMPMIIGL